MTKKKRYLFREAYRLKSQKLVVVIDSQGGGLGKAIVEKIKKSDLGVRVLGIGTNTVATMAMLKAGADDAVTGENAVLYNAQFADYIIGGLGIIAANSMLGEISPAMANAISSSRAVKLLIPVNKCNLYVVGTQENGLGEKIDEALARIQIDGD